jgi:sugar phosphate permease
LEQQVQPLEAAPARPRLRFVVIAVFWVTAIFLYFDRVNISMAAPRIMADLGLSGAAMGLVLSMFSWGFIPGQLAGGIAADRLSIRRWGSAFFLLWCLTTALTGLCRSVPQFILARTVFGFSEGAVTNPMNKLQNHWVLPRERGLVNGSLMFAAYLGLVAGMPLVGQLIQAYGWRTMFFLSGGVSVLGVLLFWLVVYDYPRQHPWISTRERDQIEAALAADRVTYDTARRQPQKLTYTAAASILFSNPRFWAICGAAFFIQMIYITNFSWLPGYLVLERGFSGIKSGNTLAIPYLAAALGALLGGHLSDRLGTRTGVIMLFATLTIPAIAGLLLIQDERGVIAMLSLLLGCNSAAIGIFVVLLFDLFPAEITGSALAISLGVCGGLGGATGPLIMGYAYDLTHSFSWGFAFMGLGMVLSLLLLAFVFPYERNIRLQKRKQTAAHAVS